MRPLTIIALLALGTAPDRAAAAPATPADEAALRETVTAYEQAIRSGDVSKSGIRRSLAAGFSAVLPSGQLIANYGELTKAENALRTMVGRGARYELTEVLVDPVMEVSGDLAAFTGRTVNKATAQAGKSLAFTTHWSAVARKEDGAWHLLRHQAVMDPSTNPWQPAGSSGPGWGLVAVAGVVCGLAGAALGFAASRLTSGARRSGAATEAPGSPPARTRAWEAAPRTPADSTSAPSQSRSWHAAPPAASPDTPADPSPDPPAPAPDEAGASTAPRPAKKRSWES